jgi:predicted ATPase/class 3 adenylate cyclase
VARELPTGTVTFLFTDIEGSTRLLEELGDRYAGAIEEHHRVLRQALAAHGGVEVDTQGDALFGVFPSAREAVASAADAQQALELPVRMGLHTGEAALAGDGYVGMDVHRAARVCDAAHGGQVLLSQTTRDLVDASVRDLGEHRLKDLSEPQPLYQLVVDGLPSDFPPLRTLEARPTNLAVQPTPLVGRERELEECRRLLGETRLLTLTGPGGTGKTRLALQLAADTLDEFQNGVFFVPLAEIADPALVMPTIAESLSATGGRELADHLRDKQILLMLDNVEHLVEAAPALAGLLAAAAGVKIVATGRLPLRLSAEQEYPVPPLPREAALELFAERARAARPGFELDGNRGAVDEICARLDRLPLAIELAAARTKLLPPQKLLERLGERLPLLTGGPRDAPARHQTLRTTIDWSFGLLDEDEQELFARLSVFASGFTLEAAEDVCAATLDGVASLIEKSLLTERETASGELRFAMLETIREYSRERFDKLGDSEAIAQRHADYFLSLAEEARSGPEEDADAGARVYPELDNVRRALAWLAAAGDVERELRLATAAFWCLWTRASLRELHGWLASALERGGDVDSGRRAAGLGAAALAAANQGQTELAREYAHESLAIARRLADKRQIEWALRVLSFDEPDLEERRRLLQECEQLLRELGAEAGLAWIAYLLGIAFHEEGDHEQALAKLEEAIDNFRRLGRRWEATNAEIMVGFALIGEDQPREARQVLEGALRAAIELESVSAFIECAIALAAARVDDDPTVAARLLAAVGRIAEDGGHVLDPRWQLPWFQATEDKAREQLGDRFEREWEAGRSLTLDEAVALALGES